MLTAKRLREVLHYDPSTGIFTRLVTVSSNACIGDIAGSIDGKGHIEIPIDNEKYKAHRLAWLYMTSLWPVDQIDHRDGVKTNNRFKNLREATQAINSQNQRRARKDNKLGLLGVCKYRKKFHAQIHINGRNKHLGYFDTPEEAHQAYLEAKRKFHPGCTL